eukprot:5741037-Prymnesium_polylepis.1
MGCALTAFSVSFWGHSRPEQLCSKTSRRRANDWINRESLSREASWRLPVQCGSCSLPAPPPPPSSPPPPPRAPPPPRHAPPACRRAPSPPPAAR